jgi:hypothetical protein
VTSYRPARACVGPMAARSTFPRRDGTLLQVVLERHNIKMASTKGGNDKLLRNRNGQELVGHDGETRKNVRRAQFWLRSPKFGVRCQQNDSFDRSGPTSFLQVCSPLLPPPDRRQPWPMSLSSLERSMWLVVTSLPLQLLGSGRTLGRAVAST